MKKIKTKKNNLKLNPNLKNKHHHTNKSGNLSN